MLDSINIDTLQQTSLNWFYSYIWTPDCGIQSALIISAFILAGIGTRVLKPRATDFINRLKIPFRFTEILHYCTKLVFPFLALIVIFIGTRIAGSEALGFNVTFAIAITKLLWAWILIRLIVQFIGNKFARNAFALIIWTIAALSIFGVLDQTSETLDAIGFSLGEFRISALGVIKGVLALAFLLYGASFLSRFTERKLESIQSLNAASRVLIGKILRIFLLAAALLIGITTAGIDLSLFAVFSGAVGLGVGFGLQRGISNLFSGMMLLVDQSIKPGDIIEVAAPDGSQTTFGWVHFMGGRYTELITRDNKSYLIPNEQLITQQVVNWSHGDTLIRIEISFGVHYNSDPHQVKAIAEEAASKPERVVDHPSPVCHLVEFGDSSLNFVMRYWIKDAEKGVTNTKGDVMLALWDAFKEHDIQIPYPHREVFLHEAA